MTLTADLFARAGRALFGDEWQNPLADLLGMNPRTVRRIAKAAREGEDYPVNETLAPVLAKHLMAAAVEAKCRAREAEALARLLT